MTPREIIAKHLCTMAAHDWDKITPFQRAAFRTTANGFLEAIHSAGYRILGPGEWDAETDWQPIETAPKDGTEILGAWSYLYEGDTAPTEGVEIISWYTGKIDGWLGRDGVAGEGVFHSWMPVPAPPAIRALAKEKQRC